MRQRESSSAAKLLPSGKDALLGWSDDRRRAGLEQTIRVVNFGQELPTESGAVIK
jgi:hypothetical protein